METLSFFLFLVAAVVNFLLTLAVYVRNPKGATNRVFALLGLTISIWVSIMYFSLKPYTPEISLMLIRLSVFFATLMSMLFFLFVNTLPNKKIMLTKASSFSLYVVTAFVMAVCISPYAFTGITFVHGEPNPTPGIGLALFGAFVISLSFTAIYKLYIKYKRATGNEQQQYLFIMLGIFLMYGLLTSTVLLPIAIFNFNKLVSLAPLYTLMFLSTTSYAIVKHRFLDIRLVVARTVSYILIIGLLAGYYGLIFSFSSVVFSGASINVNTIVISTILALLMAISFHPAKGYIEKITDKIFYKSRQSPESILKKLSQTTSKSIDISTLTNSIINTITTELRLTRGAIIILSKDNQRKIAYIFQHGYDKPIDITDSDVQFLSESSDTIVFDELLEGSKKNLLRHFKIAVCLPLTAHGEQLGLALFGEKSSGSIYTDEEINLLEIFAPEAAIAIQNALSYEEIIRFNTNLQKEVQKATEDMKSITEDVYKKNIELNHVKTQLEEANAKLKELDHLKDEFVSLASHELRTPMTAIKSYLWMFLQYNSTTLDPKERQYIERAYEATDRLITLVNDMLNVSRIESGRMNILFMPVDLPKLAKEVTEELTPTALKQNVFFKIDSPNDLPEVTGDQNKIREVLTNLVGNSLKFSNPGGTITIKMTQTDDFITTEVIDTGKGIKQEDLPKLFHKFGIVGNNYLQKTNSQGTGLGLYICKSIIELHGGNISVKSEGENKGTTFSFTLKINQATVNEQSNFPSKTLEANPQNIITSQ